MRRYTSNIKYCLAKGTIDPDEKADFYQSDLSEGFPKNDFELRIKLVKKSTSSINPIIKNLLEFFGIYNRSIDEVEEYLRSVNLSYDKDASETQKRDQFINSITDRFEMYCKRVAPRFIDLSTMNLLASFVRQHDYSAFDEPISNPFYVRYLQSEPRGSRLTKAKIITHYLLGKADISEEYRNEMYKNSIVRDFYVAYYFQGMLRKGNVQEIEELNLIFTNVVNRFIVSLMTRLQREEQLALDTMRYFFDKVNSRTRNQFAYLMGRMSRRDTVEAAQIFLKHVFKKMIKQYEHEKFDIDSLMLFRTIGVSLIYLNDSECEDDFYKILIYDRNMRTLNRNFHIEYFVAKDYKVHGGDLLKESVYEKEGILKLWNFLYHSVFVRQEREPMGLSVITMADLIIYREYIYSKEQNDELKILNFQEFYKNRLEKFEVRAQRNGA